MKILLTNDDGLSSPGLCALRRALDQLGEVTVVCPAGERSGIGHAISYRTPVEAREQTLPDGATALTLSGTPVDCVKFALAEVMDGRPDLIASGLNPGINTGIAVLYSGTVAAVIEGALYGIPSVAFSMDPRDLHRCEAAAAQAVRVLNVLRGGHWPAGRAFNVNLPVLDGAEPEIRFTRQDTSFLWTRYRRETGPAGRPCYYLDVGAEPADLAPDCDLAVVRAGCISVTPLQPELTDRAALDVLSAARRAPGET